MQSEKTFKSSRECRFCDHPPFKTKKARDKHEQFAEGVDHGFDKKGKRIRRDDYTETVEIVGDGR